MCIRDRIKTVQLNISLTNNDKLFLWSQALSSLLLKSELSHTETDGSLTTIALVVEVTVRTILQRTAIRFGNVECYVFFVRSIHYLNLRMRKRKSG